MASNRGTSAAKAAERSRKVRHSKRKKLRVALKELPANQEFTIGEFIALVPAGILPKGEKKARRKETSGNNENKTGSRKARLPNGFVAASTACARPACAPPRDAVDDDDLKTPLKKKKKKKKKRKKEKP